MPTPGGTPLADVTLEALRAGASRPRAARDAETLPGRRRGARRGRAPLAENLGAPPSWRALPTTRCSRSTPRCVRAARPRTSSRRSRCTADAARRVRRVRARGGRRARRARPAPERRRETSRAASASRARRPRAPPRDADPPEPSLGLVAMNGPGDPEPSLVIADGVVASSTAPRERFDTLDRFIAAHGIDLDIAAEAMALRTRSSRACSSTSTSRARSSCGSLAGSRRRSWRGSWPARPGRDDVRAEEAARPARARQPGARHEPQGEPGAARGRRRRGRAARVRRDARRRSACRATRRSTRWRCWSARRPGARRDDAVRGRGAPQPAARDPRPRHLRRDAVGVRHRQAFVDGDDTPWSKAFLASAYASRGVKVRFTSGTGSEALMGHAEGCSMLYLEARCLAVRAAGPRACRTAPSRASR